MKAIIGLLRRRAVAASAVAATVVLITVAVAVYVGSDRGTGTTGASTNTGATPTDSPSPSPSPTPSPTETGSPSPTPSSPASTGAPSSKPPSVRLPRITVSNMTNDDWATPRKMTEADLSSFNAATPARMTGAQQHRAAQKWVLSRGGADLRRTIITLKISAVDPDVAISGVRARITNRGPVLDGGIIWYEHGAPEPPLPASLNLEGSSPSAPEFADRSVELTVGRPVEVEVTASAIRSTVTWQLVVDFSVAGTVRSVTVDTGLSTLRTTGRAGNPSGERISGYDYADHYGSQVYFGSSGSSWGGPGPF